MRHPETALFYCTTCIKALAAATALPTDRRRTVPEWENPGACPKTRAGVLFVIFRSVNVRSGSGRPTAAAADEAHAEQANTDNRERAGFGYTNGVDRVELTVKLPGDDIVVCAGKTRS